MQPNIVSATEASRSLSEILNRVYYQGQIFDIKRGKDIIARLVPIISKASGSFKVKDLNDFFAHLPALSEEDKNSFLENVEEMRKQTPFEGRLWD